MVLPKLVEYHLSRLKDKSPDVRLKAIKELELIGDPMALEALKAVFNEDDDVDVRKAAQEAGRSIFLKHKTSATD